MQPSSELKALALRLYEVLSQGDVSALERLLSRDEHLLVIGTDPKEWLTGPPMAIETFRQQIREMGGSMPLVAGDPLAFGGNELGWIADRPAFRLPDGTELPCRITLVCQREDGEWKVVHLHCSLGVGNQEALGQELSVAEPAVPMM